MFGLGDYLTENVFVGGIRLSESVGTLGFLALSIRARLVVMESGALQVEITKPNVLRVALRLNSERSITYGKGTILLFGNTVEAIRKVPSVALAGDLSTDRCLDRHAVKCIAHVLLEQDVI